MAVYETSVALAAHSPGLRHGDDLVFNGGRYAVLTTHLSHSGGHNDGIFKELGLNAYAFCSECYGYSVTLGQWPSYKSGDYAAATRVAMALFDIIEGNNDNPLVRVGRWVDKVRAPC